jgi:gentisate 1,2-dioxygenase
MTRGDLVITPFCEWHDHGNESKEPVFWIDVLDVPLIDYCNASIAETNYTENGVPRTSQTAYREHGFSSRMFGGVGVMPRFGWDDRKGRCHTPKYFYDLSEVREAQNVLRNEKGSPFDGIIVEYVDPASGQSVVPTMSFCSQLLRPRERTWDQRKTASTVFCAFEGSGVTIVNGQRLEWSKNDIFVVPGWHWYHHENVTDSDAVLFSVSDEPAQRLLGCFVSQGRDLEGQPVLREPFGHSARLF